VLTEGNTTLTSNWGDNQDKKKGNKKIQIEIVWNHMQHGAFSCLRKIVICKDFARLGVGKLATLLVTYCGYIHVLLLA
jgi:hypothetical protein